MTVWLPTKPPTPCPPVLTAEEAVIYLRLDKGGAKQPLRTLEYYRASGMLPAVRLGKCTRYRIEDLQRFVASKSETAPT